MPNRGLAPDKRGQIEALLLDGGKTQQAIAELCGVASGTVSNVKRSMQRQPPIPEVSPQIETDKKVGEFDIDEWFDWMETGQSLKKKASWSQNTAAIKLGEGDSPQILFQLGDSHIASWGTSHKLCRGSIKDIEETPNLWAVLMGDLIQMSIKMRSVLEVSDNMLPPEQQAQLLEAVLDRIMHKVAWSSWCNHGVEREEKQSGISMVKNILARRTVYFNGIGHPDVQVGSQVYKFACSHKFRGNSMFDSTFGPKRYARMEANDREIILQADLHRGAISQYFEGGMHRLAITNGTYQLNSGYAARYFSLFTQPTMPCVVLHGDVHKFVPFWSLEDAKRYIGTL